MARILIIDDEAVVREFLRDALTVAGHTVIEAEDGQDGVEAFRRDAVDLVITDIMMPRKDGLTAIRELRNIRPDLNIIAIAAVGDPMLEQARDLGANMTFDKPFHMGEMLQAVEELVKDRS